MRKVLVILLTTFALVLTAAPFANASLPAYKVTMTVNKTVSEAGRFVTVSGKVIGPRAAGKKVTVQRKYVDGAWTTVAYAIIKSTGGYSARVETPRGGTTSFRVLKPRSAVRKAGVSPTRSLPVYEWLYLANEAMTVTNGSAYAPFEMKLPDGIVYKRSIGFYNDDTTLQYKLGGVCTKFTTRVGYRAAQPETDDAMTVILGNGFGTTGSYPVAVGTTITINASTASLKYFSVDMDSVLNVAGLGNPRVFCNADHLPSLDATDG